MPEEAPPEPGHEELQKAYADELRNEHVLSTELYDQRLNATLRKYNFAPARIVNEFLLAQRKLTRQPNEADVDEAISITKALIDEMTQANRRMQHEFGLDIASNQDIQGRIARLRNEQAYWKARDLETRRYMPKYEALYASLLGPAKADGYFANEILVSDNP